MCRRRQMLNRAYVPEEVGLRRSAAFLWTELANLVQLKTRSQYNKEEKQVEEHLVVEADILKNGIRGSETQDQADDYAGQNRQHSLVYGLYAAGLEDIAGEQRRDQQADEKGERLCCRDFALRGVIG